RRTARRQAGELRLYPDEIERRDRALRPCAHRDAGNNFAEAAERFSAAGAAVASRAPGLTRSRLAVPRTSFVVCSFRRGLAVSNDELRAAQWRRSGRRNSADLPQANRARD